MVKARSRLKKPVDPIKPVIEQTGQEVVAKDRLTRKKDKPGQLSWLIYLKHLPTLILSLVFYTFLLYLFFNVDPDTIKNVFLPGFYLPFLVLLFLANWFLFSFLFLNSKRGFFYSMILTIVAFLKFQDVVFTWQVVVTFAMIFIGYESLALFYRLRRKT